uniref:Phosphoribulokinase/uridine kinase domain-containing protein n=1 Tax=Lactuca sativa TaxID=4236 RepID=A0A9R1XF74_LACSA|nr:hypothetical protein LSAT_V11C400196680 [Lactuca sativa]
MIKELLLSIKQDTSSIHTKTLQKDSFYRSLSDEHSTNAQDYNFDHPDSFNTELLLSCMETLKKGQLANISDYDYMIHKSSGSIRMVNPSEVIILEVIIVLHDSKVGDMMNIKIFVDSNSLLIIIYSR